MGLLKLFTNPAGWAMDKMKDKVQDKVTSNFGSKAGESSSGAGPLLSNKRGNFMDNLFDTDNEQKAGFGKIVSQVQEKTGYVGNQIDKLRNKALEGGDTRAALLEHVRGIQDRDLPEVDEYKPAGKAAEWMNRLGAGLYAAGGGNPEDIYRNFRNKEMVKQERHQRQVENRQAAVESRDDDITAVLSNVDQLESETATRFATARIQQETSMQAQSLDAQMRSLENSVQLQSDMVQIQAGFDKQREAHEQATMRMDKQGQLDEYQIRLGAEIGVRNEMTANMMTFGINPAAMQETISAAASGNYENMTKQDHVRLQMYANMQKANTDEELMLAKTNAIMQVVGTRVHAKSAVTGEDMYDDNGNAVFTNLANFEDGASWVLGGQQAYSDAIASGSISGEAEALESFFSRQGTVTPEFSSGTVETPSATRNANKGYPSTEAATFNAMEADPRDAKEQMANMQAIFEKGAAMINQDAKFADVLEGMRNSGLHPEVMQAFIQKSMETGLWDGQEDHAKVNEILMLGAGANPNSQ